MDHEARPRGACGDGCAARLPPSLDVMQAVFAGSRNENMRGEMLYRLLADLVLVLHLGFVAFVVLGLVAIITGNLRRWAWVNNFWFRLCHLLAICVVVAQTWMEILCPLTGLENWLRERAGEGVYAGGFIQHWVEAVLYYDAPGWVFAAAYTLFGLAIAGCWWYFPPASGRRADRRRQGKPL